MSKLFIIVCIILFLTPLVDAESISLDNWTFDLGDGAYINLPYTFNATNFTLTNGQLQVYLNDSQLQWRTTSNKTLTNIKIDNVSDEYSFTGSGTSGYLSFSSTMNNASSNYSLWLDDFFNSYANSTIGKQVTFNYTAAWSSHDFVINSTPEPTSPTPSTPTYTGSWWNSITNDTSLIVHLTGSATFRIIYDNTTSVNWTQDGINLSETSSNLTTSFISIGHHNITAQGITMTGLTPLITWQILKTKTMAGAGDVLEPLDTSGFTLLKNAMSGDTASFQSFFTALMTPYTTPMGSAFFIFLYVLPLIVIWVRQEKALLPVGLMIIFGAVLSSSLPPSWILPAQLIMALTTVGILYGIFKERG